MQAKVRTGILIFFLALAIRVFYLEEIKDAFLFYHPIVDSGAYDYDGARLAEARTGEGDISGLRRIPFYRSFLAYLCRLQACYVFMVVFSCTRTSHKYFKPHSKKLRTGKIANFFDRIRFLIKRRKHYYSSRSKHNPENYRETRF